MTENESKYGKVVIVGGGRNAGRTMQAQVELLARIDELEAYRAIGTVEEIQSMKDNGAFSGVELAQIATMQMKLKNYQSIGTIEEFKALKEKAEPKKLKHDVCPNCSTNNDKIIKHLGNPQAHKVVFCWNCGQALET